ncbi:hypothetical protein MGG_07026 [Pyricularia oryzae 70-15]|uniref:Interferon-related developmental regulator N-terminal domain-containing protein n=3 Tax=Pyricularia oryzae TaxID=318829 RepID=G4MZN7_PYRO7|nr:uncharacterized protein MGG_07026 [Pyricularia oryzae 70-15]EHA55401.1 hypothetical protein MGG_07026 [Pyricularia oryzae 70-15]ELQ37217.1 hypothetical protein OOU_Y34scaffold00610g54 [Pyricularia oryzae Y34]KAI7924662.1 hypothetical protein M0657_004526 [Pyricularia oryzae]KAI7925239.1 hypothetical protein M9X92_003418 [Pyricularia oryzae]
MSDLRKQILLGGSKSNESRKTISRKARSRPESGLNSSTNSPITSPGVSRPNSRPSSRYPSEDEDGSDHMTDSASDSESSALWEQRLDACITELPSRKRSSGAGRSGILKAYLHLIRHHYAEAKLEKSVSEVLPSLLRSIKNGTSTEEKSFAIKALAVTILTYTNDDMCEQIVETLKNVCEDERDEDVKADALYTMSIAIIYGGGLEAEMEDMLEYLTTIIQSDGDQVNALDSGKVVSAALQSWAFVATSLDSLDAQSYEALEAFSEQLDSGDVDVQISAGVNIALLFEVSRNLEEADTGDKLNLHIDPKVLVKRMSELAKGSKSISKRSRRNLRSSFASIITSLETNKGPGWRDSVPEQPKNAYDEPDPVDDPTILRYRHKLTVAGTTFWIDTWAALIRVEMMKRVLKGGFLTHFEDNPVFFRSVGGLMHYES